MDSQSAYDPHARPVPHEFYPPTPNSMVIGFVQRTIRRTIRRRLKVVDIDIPADDLDRLREVVDQRCLITPSHSGGFEPHIMMWLSHKLGTYFNYVAALEVFEQSPMNRWVMPRLGCYSILRGAIDRQSFAMTRKLLAEGKRPLVIFPEGEAIGQNSMLMPFQEGVFQLAMKAYEDARQADQYAQLRCVPIAVKYIFVRDMHHEIDESLTRLELQLGLSPSDRPKTHLERLHRISNTVLAVSESARGIRPPEDASLDERIQNLKTTVVSKLEHQLNLQPRGGQTMLDRIRAMFNAVDRIVQQAPPTSAYHQQLQAQQASTAKSLYNELWRLLRFVAVYDGYVSEAMTVERMMDILGLLEYEVFGKRCVWGPRKAYLKVGEFADLRERFDAYCHDKRATVQGLTMAMENSVRDMLLTLGMEHESPLDRC